MAKKLNLGLAALEMEDSGIAPPILFSQISKHHPVPSYSLYDFYMLDYVGKMTRGNVVIFSRLKEKCYKSMVVPTILDLLGY